MLVGDVLVMLAAAIQRSSEIMDKFYTSTEIKQFLAGDSKSLAYQYARLFGLLFTPDYPD